MTIFGIFHKNYLVSHKKLDRTWSAGQASGALLYASIEILNYCLRELRSNIYGAAQT